MVSWISRNRTLWIRWFSILWWFRTMGL